MVETRAHTSLGRLLGAKHLVEASLTKSFEPKKRLGE